MIFNNTHPYINWFFFISVPNTWQKAAKEKEGILAHSLKALSTVTGKIPWQEYQVAGYIVSTVKNQRY